jgi:hypothetical protein
MPSSPLRPLPPVAGLAPPPAAPSHGTPTRPAGSARRTSHLSITWPGGRDAGAVVEAAARDLVTTAAGAAVVAGSAALRVSTDRGRVITSVASTPQVDALDGLVGGSGGPGYRKRLRSVAAEEEDAGSLLHFLLDDVPGVTLVGPSSWQLWPGSAAPAGARAIEHARWVSDVCSGWRSDGPPIQRILSSGGGLAADAEQNLPAAPDLARPGDSLAWHPVPAPPPDAPMMTRRRRVDVTPATAADGSPAGISVTALFRDSIWGPERTERVVHEYGLHAVVDPVTMCLTEVTAEPRVLPFGTCPAAAGNTDLIIGEPVRTLRRRVLALITGTDGCTHLSDALRALAEVPVLLEALAGRVPG